MDLNKEFKIINDIDELSELVPYLLSENIHVKFPESKTSEHTIGTYYRLDTPTISSLIISISGSITAIVALITAIISFRKEKAKEGNNSNNTTTIVLLKKTIIITENSIVEDICEEIKTDIEDNASP